MTKTCQFVCVLAGSISLGCCLCASAADSLTVIQQKAAERGYRLREVWWDPVLQQRWAALESVAHPEQPLLSKLTDFVEPQSGGGSTGAISVAKAAPVFAQLKRAELAVRSGESVTLWSAEDNVRMEISAVALSNAIIGDRIQLRVTGAGLNGDAGWRVSGIVRAAGNVEWER